MSSASMDRSRRPRKSSPTLDELAAAYLKSTDGIFQVGAASSPLTPYSSRSSTAEQRDHRDTDIHGQVSLTSTKSTHNEVASGRIQSALSHISQIADPKSDTAPRPPPSLDRSGNANVKQSGQRETSPPRHIPLSSSESTRNQTQSSLKIPLPRKPRRSSSTLDELASAYLKRTASLFRYGVDGSPPSLSRPVADSLLGYGGSNAQNHLSTSMVNDPRSSFAPIPLPTPQNPQTMSSNVTVDDSLFRPVPLDSLSATSQGDTVKEPPSIRTGIEERTSTLGNAGDVIEPETGRGASVSTLFCLYKTRASH